MKTRTRQAGFTLTELLVVIGIIALMGAMVIPSTIAMVGSHRRTAAKGLIRTALAQAQAHASKTQKYAGVRFQFNADGWKNGRQYMVIIENDTSTAIYDKFVAVPNAKPLALPVGMGVIALDSLSYGNGNPDENLDEGQEHHISGADWGILDAATFSIIFSPTGQLITKIVEVNPISGQRIFGTENATHHPPSYSDFRLLSHDSSAASAPWCEKENSTTGLYIFETDRMAEADPFERYSQYVRELKPFLINIYTGMLIEEEF